MVKEDDEVGVASICLESLTELLKECKSGVSGAHPDFPEAIVATVRAVLKSECACMDNEPEEGEEDEEESEQVSHTRLLSIQWRLDLVDLCPSTLLHKLENL